MENRVAQSIPALLTQAGDIAHGAGELGAAIPLVLNPKAAILSDTSPVLAKMMTHLVAMEEMAARRLALDTKTKEVQAFLTLARELLKPELGKKHNPSWVVSGFVNSLRISRNNGHLLPQLLLLNDFLTANSGYELAARQITADSRRGVAQRTQQSTLGCQGPGNGSEGGAGRPQCRR